MLVLPLPEAVKKRMIHLKDLRNKPTEINAEDEVTKDELSLENALKLAVLEDAPRMPGGEYIGMYSASVEPWPHQEIVSRRLIESYPYSYLLCDEVGLGKTIEAALAIRSLILSGQVKRVLIIAPASLTHQWQRELAQKAGLSFALSKPKPGATNTIKHSYIYPTEYEIEDKNLYTPELNIISSGLIAREERLKTIDSVDPYDIILLDEAQFARRQNQRDGVIKAPKYGKLYQALQNKLRKRCRCLWLATATPMQIDPIEVYDLFRLMNRTSVFQSDPTLTMAYFTAMGKIAAGKKLGSLEWSILGRNYAQLEMMDPYYWNMLQESVVSNKNKKVLERLPDNSPKRADIRYLKQPLMAASPLSRVMLRHTRQLLEIYRDNNELSNNLAKRIVRPICAVKFTDAENSFYQMLEEYCNELMKQIRKNNSENNQMMFFLLNFLQLRFASSLYAIKMTLTRRLTRVQNTLLVGAHKFDSQEELEEFLDDINDGEDFSEEDISDIRVEALLKDRTENDLNWEEKKLKEMLERLEDIEETPSKIQALLEELDDRRLPNGRLKQTVLFTRFWDSLFSIQSYLNTREPELRIGIYSGKFARWYNPESKRMEDTTHERIKDLFIDGQIDLLLCTDAAAEGLNLQTADLLINFDLGWNPMKVEQRIGRIDRIGQKHEVIEVLNMCYLGSTEETVYGRLLERLKQANLVVGTQQISLLPVNSQDFRELEEGKITEEQLEKKSIEQLQKQQEASAAMEMTAQDQYDMYNRLNKELRGRSFPAYQSDIKNILNDLSIETESQTSKESWGSDKFTEICLSAKTILQKYSNAVKQISVKGENREILGYAVAIEGSVILVKSFSDLQNIKIDVNHSITDKELENVQKQLRKEAKREMTAYDTVERVEKDNILASNTEKKLLIETAKQILLKEDPDGQINLWDALKHIEENEKTLRIVEIPLSAINNHEELLLFRTSILDDKLILKVEGVLLTCTLDFIKRTAMAMKVAKKELSTSDVIGRLNRISG